jgi:DNA-binding transcriptional ArsR family regulator
MAAATEGKNKATAALRRNKAMSHEVRRAILRHYVERGPKAPIEISHELAIHISKVSYHTRKLLEYDCIELVRTKAVRGSTKHFYRATDRHLVDESGWDELDPATREGILGDVMQPIVDDFTAAVTGETLGLDGRFHITREPLRSMDREGYDELLAAHMRLYQETHEIARRSAERMVASGEPSIAVSSGQACFIVPGF